MQQGLTQLQEYCRNALRYWEPRRLLYNLILAIIVVWHFLAGRPESLSSINVDGLLQLFVLAVLANVVYSAVYLADVFIQLSGRSASRRQWRLALLLIGFTLAAVLAHFISSGIASHPGGSS